MSLLYGYQHMVMGGGMGNFGTGVRSSIFETYPHQIPLKKKTVYSYT